MKTATTAKPLWENSSYQERARLLLPRLVRQAKAGESICYSDLASELKIPNPRNLNWSLGSIGESLRQLGTKWRERVPQIQCMVVSKSTGLPGVGFDGFVDGDYRSLPKVDRERLVRRLQHEAIAYRKWPEVLGACGLEPLKSDAQRMIAAVAALRGGSGESPDHKRLKEYVAATPRVIGLTGAPPGEVEFGLPSGDSVDVVFDCADQWVAVEVKSMRSDDDDVRRGVFQCIKYRAVGRACQSLLDRPKSVRTVLVLEGAIPPDVVPLKNQLAVEVIEKVTPR